MGFKPTLTAAVIRQIPVPDSKATVEFTCIRSGVMANLTNASMGVVSKQSGSGMNAEISFDTTKKNRDIVNACVTDWSGFKDENGNNLKFNAKNLATMMDNSSEFTDWVVETHEKIFAEVEGSEEEVTKNSKN